MKHPLGVPTFRNHPSWPSCWSHPLFFRGRIPRLSCCTRLREKRLSWLAACKTLLTLTVSCCRPWRSKSPKSCTATVQVLGTAGENYPGVTRRGGKHWKNSHGTFETWPNFTSWPSLCLNWFSSKLLVNSLGARCLAMARSKMLSDRLQAADAAPERMASMASLLWRMVGSKALCSMASNCHNTCGQVLPEPGQLKPLEVSIYLPRNIQKIALIHLLTYLLHMVRYIQ